MKKTILIVDDAAFMRKSLKDIIAKSEYEVIGEAIDGNDAIEKYTELKPDLLLLDITMPYKDGITALKEIKALDPNVVCIILSAMGQQDFVKEALTIGAKDFLVKPFHPVKALKTIKKVMEE